MFKNKIDINVDTKEFELYFRPGFDEKGKSLFNDFLEFIRPIGRWDKIKKCWCLPATNEHLKILERSGFDFGVDKQFKEKLKELYDIRNAWHECDQIEIADFGKTLYPFQKQAVGFLVQHCGRALIADEMGCISGDCVIIVNRNGGSRRRTLRQLYEKFNGINKGKKWDLSIPSYTQSMALDRSEFRLNKINKVIYKGIQPVFLLRTENHSIEATADHVFFTKDSEKAMQDLKVGDFIYVNGERRCICCGGKEYLIKSKYSKYYGYCKNCMLVKRSEGVIKNNSGERKDKNGYILRVNGVKNHPYCRTDGIFKHRLVYEAYLNGMSYESWLDVIKYNKFTNSHKFLTPDMIVHHIDGNILNNKISNLELTDYSGHQKRHLRYKNFKSLFIPKLEKITSIEYIGEKDVYDLQMEAPNHNFIVNGIVVHNCGKTIETLAYFALNRYCLPVLFIVPNIVKYNWQKEIGECLREEVEVLTSRNITKADFSKFNYFIVNYDIMHKPHVFEILKDVKFNSIVLDEVHYIKSFSAKRTKTIKKLVKEINPKSLIGLTGTPIRNRPSEIFNFLNMLRPDIFSSFTKFAFRYCELKESPFGGSVYVYKDGRRVAYQVGVGVKNYKELHLKLKDAGMIRRKKSDVLRELPQKIYSTRLVDIDNRDEYCTAERDIAEWIRQTDLIMQNEKDQRIKKALRAKYIVKLTYLSRLVAEGKYTSLLDTIYDLLSCEDKVVVFGIHTDPLLRLFKDLKRKGIKSVVLTGKNNNVEKEEAIREFQNGKARVFIGSMFAAGIGITLTASSSGIIFEYPWTPDVYEQAVDRLHRIGQKNSVSIYNLVGVHTIDDYMMKVLDEKRTTAVKIVDGFDPGINTNSKIILDDVLDKIREKYNVGALLTS